MTQLDLIKNRERERDRNYDKGGRSFYFFDLDDNVFFLSTPVYLFHKQTKAELNVSALDLARYSDSIGKSGPYQDYHVDFCDINGTYRRCRDRTEAGVQPFLEDLKQAFEDSKEWKGPSWNCFYHAAFNQRPISLITARGHHPETIKAGISMMVEHGHLPEIPNYLSIYPVSHPETQRLLSSPIVDRAGPVPRLSIAELKLKAVIESVETAMQVYGYNPHHRFGMSDDDPKNLELILQAMLILKNKYPENSFFVIHTKDANYVKEEVFLDHIETHKLSHLQATLF